MNIENVHSGGPLQSNQDRKTRQTLEQFEEVMAKNLLEPLKERIWSEEQTNPTTDLSVSVLAHEISISGSLGLKKLLARFL